MPKTTLQETLEVARKQLRNSFKSFDTDQSGTIERHELAQLLRRLTDSFDVEQPSDDDINVILNQLDTNGDGRISQGEFESLVDNVMTIIEEDRTGKKKE